MVIEFTKKRGWGQFLEMLVKTRVLHVEYERNYDSD